MKKKFLSVLTCSILIVISICSLPVFAANDATSADLGFAISKDSYGQFGYILENTFKNYYDNKIVGVTTYSYSYCRSEQKALGYYSDLCAIRVLTEPCTITLDKQILFVKYKQTCKFGIESLGVESNKSTLNTASNPFKVNRVEYLTTADSATKSHTTGSSLSSSFLGAAGISISNSETIDKCIVDVTDNSTRTKMALSFEFGKPKTTQQEERVYEQTYYYILQEYLSNRKEYTNSTTFTVVYNCDSKTSSKIMTVNTPLKFK